ncbi:MAG: hypothetical protein LBF81_06505 [Prevotellaceae bacterium]|jgi:hypothetical protein|nr:hypothetical protein [Prevotellaceae bacterium]
MKKQYDTYPRGVILSATSPTSVILNMPASAADKAVFWLARSGFVYKTYQDAIQDTAAEIPQESLAGITLYPSERLFYKRGEMNVIPAPGREISVLPGHLFVVSCVESPFCLPVKNQKPGNKSTIWISRNHNAFHTYTEALNDKPDNETKAVAALQQKVTKLENRKKHIGWLVTLVALLFVIYAFKKYGKQQSKYAGSRAAVSALPE